MQKNPRSILYKYISIRQYWNEGWQTMPWFLSNQLQSNGFINLTRRWFGKSIARLSVIRCWQTGVRRYESETRYIPKVYICFCTNTIGFYRVQREMLYIRQSADQSTRAFWYESWSISSTEARTIIMMPDMNSVGRDIWFRYFECGYFKNVLCQIHGIAAVLQFSPSVNKRIVNYFSINVIFLINV